MLQVSGQRPLMRSSLKQGLIIAATLGNHILTRFPQGLSHPWWSHAASHAGVAYGRSPPSKHAGSLNSYKAYGKPFINNPIYIHLGQSHITIQYE